jgi:hypothetical protein
MTVAESFSDKVYDYIRNQYGKNTLKFVQADNHKTTVSKFLDTAEKNNHDIDRTANKIIAMLRVNP